MLTKTFMSGAVLASVLLASIFGASATAQDAVQWSIDDGGNGHWYVVESVLPERISWEESRQLSLNRGGEMFTITSQEENQFICNNFCSLPDMDIPDYRGLWIGLRYVNSEWAWETGEPLSYTNWTPNQPDGLPQAAYAVFERSGTWGNEVGDSPYDPVWLATEYSADCNGDGIVDYGQILDGTLVDDDGDGIPDCCSDESCEVFTINVPEDFATIQEAISNAPYGSLILVGPGTHGGFTTNGLPMTIRAAAGPLKTILTGGSQGGTAVICSSGETPETVIDGFMIRDCTTGGMSINQASPTIINCHFHDNNDANGGAGVAVNDGSPVITNCDFASNDGGASNGGAVVVDSGSNPTLRDCTFTSNTAAIGAGISFANSTGSMTGCTFTANVASNNGGGMQNYNSSVSITDCTFTENVSNAYGAAVMNDGSDGSILEVVGCTFHANEAEGLHGGAIYNNNSTTTATDCVFSSNVAADEGGALWGNSDCIITLLRCDLLDNVCEDSGGAVFANGGVAVTATDCLFQWNNAPGNGGAICAGGSDQINLNNCTFFGNAASGKGGRGGGLYCDDPFEVVTFEGCVFRENTAVVEGAGVFLKSGTLDMTGTLFEDNTAQGSAGLRAESSTVNATQCLFAGNRATGTDDHGGFAYLYSTGATFTSCVFYQNEATGLGGAFICYNEPVRLEQCQLIENVAGTSGGAVYLNGSNNRLTVVDSTICGTDPWYAKTGSAPYPVLQGNNQIDAQCENTGIEFDCNDDGVNDILQILEDPSLDCNGNLVLDLCELSESLVLSVDRTPDSPDDFIEFDLSSSPDASSDVELEVAMVGDLEAQNQFAFVSLDDVLLGYAFVEGAPLCERSTASFVITSQQWNDAGLDGERRIRISGLNITTDACAEPLTEIALAYEMAIADCNDNGTWDECESDGDGDGVIDDCDGCPDDPAKTEAGACGCGVADIDSDDDGIPDCSDSCPFWPGDCSEDGQTLFVSVGESIQFAIDVVSSGGVVALEEGSYQIDATLVPGGKSFTLRGATDIDGNPMTTLDGSGDKRALLVEGNGAEVVVVENFTIENCRAAGSGSEAHGGAIRVLNSDVVIRNCVFTANTASEYGGALNIHDDDGDGVHSVTTIEDCDFVLNTANRGGALSLYGGDAMVSGCLFDRNDAADEGGGIHCNIAYPTIDDCLFTGNSAFDGGAFYRFGDGEASVTHCVFTENVSSNNGGGACCYTANLTAFVECVFSDNAAPYGAAYQGNSAVVKFDGCTFSDNEASQNGGAININKNSDLTVTTSIFLGNSAVLDGGGVYAVNSLAEIVSCQIQGNSANSGGGLFTALNTISVNATTICGNIPDQISGSFDTPEPNCISEICDSDSDGTLDCLDGCPDDPQKTEPGACGCGVEDLDRDGDGIPDCIDSCPDWPYDCADGGSTLVVAVGQSIQLAIDLVPSGGTVELGAGVFVQGVLDSGGKALTLRGATDINGALATTIDAQGSGSVFVFQSGEGLDTELRNLVLTGGSATYGGGIECSNGSSPSIIDCMIIGNTASEYGGGINCYLDCAPLIERCAFIGNSATLAGGGISCDQSAPRILGCMIQGNESALGGGVYSLQSADTEISGSSICGNTTDQVNGAFEDAGGNCILDECGSDLDGNGVPDACDPDCDGDGEPDAWEISSGQAADCNENLVPDVCEIDDGLVEDCNGNGIPDGCDVADGSEDDANDNGIPDTCDLVRGDLNLDGCIDGADLAQLLSLWGLPNPPIGDLNGDLVIDGLDLGTLLANWSLCP